LQHGAPLIPASFDSSAPINRQRAARVVTRSNNKEKTMIFYVSIKPKAQFEITVRPSHIEVLSNPTPLLWSFHNGGPGRVQVEAHNDSPANTFLSAGDIAEFSGTGPITLDAVDHDLAVVIVTVLAAGN
jgi:hypothetical protein